MPKITKEELQKANTLLSMEVDRLIGEERRLREVFSDLLGSEEFTQEYGFSDRKSRKVVLQSWEGIAFLIGELTADANYSCVIDSRDRLKEEKQVLIDHIHHLENPEIKKPL